MIVFKETLSKTCESHPSQWEGITTDGVGIYIRYRHGTLIIDIPFGDTYYQASFSSNIYDGFMETSKMIMYINSNVDGLQIV